MEERRVWLHELTRPAFEEYLATEPKPVALIPLGSIEQHGPHLPLGTDILGAMRVAEMTARKANGVAVLSTMVAYSPHHLGFKGTLTLSEETLIHYLTDVIASLAHHGVRRVMLVNMHGGNEEIAALVARVAARKTGAFVAKPRSRTFTITPELIASLDIHAGELETAVVLAVAPELVDQAARAAFTTTEQLPEDVLALLDATRPDAFLAQQVANLHIGDTHTHTASGVYGFKRPQDARAEVGLEFLEDLSSEYARFIALWRQVRLDGE